MSTLFPALSMLPAPHNHARFLLAAAPFRQARARTLQNLSIWLSDRYAPFGFCRFARRLALLNRLRASFLSASLAGLALLGLPSASFAQTPSPDPVVEGQTTYEAIKDQWSSSDAFSANLGTPLAAETPMTTLDGSVSFSGSVSCASSANFLELFYGVGAGGDMSPVSVKQDTDFDGVHDLTVTAPVHVSGVCTNGVISCDAGTWNACQYYLWDADAATHTIGMTAATLPDMKACYCVNNSCGVNLALANKDDILSDLGGGMVSALSQVEPRYTVSQTAITGTSIMYSGQQSTACTTDPSLAETAYYTSASAMSSDAWSETSSNAVYSAATTGAILTGEAETAHACHTNRVIDVISYTFNDIISVTGSINSQTSCGTDCTRFRIQGDGSCSPYRDVTANFNVLLPDRIDSVRITHLGADDWVQARLNGAYAAYAGKRVWTGDGIPSGDCRVGGKYYASPNLDISDEFTTTGAVTIGARVRAGGGGAWGYVDVEVRVRTGCETTETISDTCGSYTGSPTCRMVQETADGVDTFLNGVHTGLQPLPSTRTMTSAACTVNETRDWWDRTRTFGCEVEGALAPTIDLSRVDYVINNSSVSTYADQRDDGAGGFITDGGTLNPPDVGLVGECEMSCKVSRVETEAQVSNTGVTGDLQTNPSAGIATAYKACSTTAVCPVDPGESIVTDCQCIDDFPEAFVMMQAVRLAGQDTVCTTGLTSLD